MAKNKRRGHEGRASAGPMSKRLSAKLPSEPPDPGDLPPLRSTSKPLVAELRRSLGDPLNVLAAVYLLAIICTGLYYLGPAVTRTWFYSSDEYVVVAEIIRF